MTQETSQRAIKKKSSDIPIIDVMPQPVNETTMRDILGMLKRRRKLLASVVSVGMIGTAVFLFLATPKFEAKGQLLIDNRASQVKNIKSIIETRASDISDVPNEVQLLMSRVLAGAVVDSLGLGADPEFNPTMSRSRVADGNKPVANGVAGTEKAADAGTPVAAPVAVNAAGTETSADAAKTVPVLMYGGARAKILDNFLKRLDVNAERRSRVVDVTFRSADPEKAAQIVNMLMKSYLNNQVRNQKETLEKATGRLDKIVSDLKLEVTKAEATIQNFRAKSRLIDVKRGTSVTGQQLEEYNSRLIQARAEEAAHSARLKQTMVLLKSDGSMNASPEVLRSALIQRLREKEAELERQRSDLTTRYGDRHPKIIKVQAEILDLRAKIQDEVNKIVESLSNEVAIAKAKSAALRSGLAKLETKAIDVNRMQGRFEELERDLISKRTQYQTFLVRLRETSALQAMVEPSARIVSFAEVPARPAFPRPGLTLALAGMFSALAAFMIVMIAEALRRTFETTNEAENILRVRPLGAMSKLTSLRKFLARPEDVFSGVTSFHLAQCIQSIRSTLYLANNSQHPKSVLVTSALPEEGKTTFALVYASFCALKGQRVIVLDCDFIQPKLHQHLSVTNDEGLANVLMDKNVLQRVIRTSPNGGFDFITSGQSAMGKPELLDAAAMQELLQTLSWDYDVIVVDTSPVLSVANAPVLARQVDSTVFVVQWRKTRRDLAKVAIQRLQSVGGAPVSGFVLSNVNPRLYEGPDNLFDSAAGDIDNEGFVRRMARRLGFGGGYAGVSSVSYR